jgi:UDP-3-O-acyl N-acetylglucosamine deacetylase
MLQLQEKMNDSPLILVVDDEESICTSLEGVFKDENFRTATAQSGEEALAKVREQSPDVVFLDIWMPGWDGMETLARIKEIAPTTQVVMISGHATISNAMEALKRGAMDFVEKPFHIDSVIRLANRGVERCHYEQSQNNVPQENSVRLENDTTRSNFYLSEHKGINSSGMQGRNIGQRTLKDSVILYGQCLHSGVKSGLILEPLPSGSGIHFAEIGGSRPAPVFVDYVQSTELATTVKLGGTSAATIEHLMSALHAYGISNLLIKCNGEVPIFDGSASEFCEVIESVGLQEQDGDWFEIAVDREITFKSEGSGESITLSPSDKLEVEYFLDYPEPVGRQIATFIASDVETYKKEIAPARTFGFMSDIERLQRSGLAAGGRLDNFILIGPDKVINTELRFENELARHKILDIIGDLFLIGRPLRAKITANMTGHSDNINVLKKINEILH